MRIGDHLLPVRYPARGARDGEQYREHRARYPQGAVDDAGIKIDVGIELARYEIFVLERDLLELEREVEDRMVAAAELLEHAVAHFANDLGAWVEVLVDTVSEAHQAHAVRLVLDPGEELVDVRRRADAVQHGEHRFVGAPVSGAPERGYTRGNRRIGVCAGAARQAHRRGARVLLVIGVEYEQQVHRLRGYRVDRIRLARHREEH